MHTGIARLGFSAIGFFAQYVAVGQSSKSPQQYGRQSATRGCEPSVAQPRPGPQSDADWQGALTSPDPITKHCEVGTSPIGLTWHPSVALPPEPVEPEPVGPEPVGPELVDDVPLEVPLEVDVAPPAPLVPVDPPLPELAEDAPLEVELAPCRQAVVSPPGTQRPKPQYSVNVSFLGGLSPSGEITLASPPVPTPVE